MTNEPSDLELKRRVLSLLCEQQAKEILRMDRELKVAKAVVEALKECWSDVSRGTDPVLRALEAYDKALKALVADSAEAKGEG